MHRSRALRCVFVWVLLGVCCRAFELQDTIHALIEENIHLHDQLENLTRALRELRQLLFHHSDGRMTASVTISVVEKLDQNDNLFNPEHDHEHDEELQHLWEEWSQHSITPETHLLLEHALCGHDLHSSTHLISGHTAFLFILTVIMLAHFLF